MEEMGEAAIEPVFEAYENEDIDHIAATSILSKAGKGNARCFEFIQSHFEKSSNNDIDIDFLAEMLLTCDEDKAIPYLENHMKKVKYSSASRTRIAKYIQDIKDGLWPL